MLDGLGGSAGQFLLRKVKNRAVGQPFGVAFAGLCHCDDVLSDSRLVIRPPSLSNAVRHALPLLSNLRSFGSLQFVVVERQVHFAAA
jgi:hypothetical protein